jgi:hypothetical protein
MSDEARFVLTTAFDWKRWPKLAGIFEHRPRVNVYWTELADFIAFVAYGVSVPGQQAQKAADALSYRCAQLEAQLAAARGALEAGRVAIGTDDPMDCDDCSDPDVPADFVPCKRHAAADGIADALAALATTPAATAAARVCEPWCGGTTAGLPSKRMQWFNDGINENPIYCTQACRDNALRAPVASSDAPKSAPVPATPPIGAALRPAEELADEFVKRWYSTHDIDGRVDLLQRDVRMLIEADRASRGRPGLDPVSAIIAVPCPRGCNEDDTHECDCACHDESEDDDDV